MTVFSVLEYPYIGKSQIYSTSIMNLSIYVTVRRVHETTWTLREIPIFSVADIYIYYGA